MGRKREGALLPDISKGWQLGWCFWITLSQKLHGLSRSTLNNFLQLFAHTENSEWFSMIYVIIFEVNIVAEEKQA